MLHINTMRVRRLIYKQLHQGAWGNKGISIANRVVISLICLSVFIVILETEKPLLDRHKQLFSVIDWTLGSLFLIEYAMRVWSAGEHLKYRGIIGRLRYMITPFALIDLAVVVPFFIMANSNIFVARFVRLCRIFAITRLCRYSEAFTLVREALWSRRHELFLSFVITGIVILIASTIMWVVEPDDEFSSIPRAIWWGVITLTTVGYGDVLPVTLAGKICSCITALAGIGLIAMPTGILAAAFGDAFRKHRQMASIRDDLMEELAKQESTQLRRIRKANLLRRIRASRDMTTSVHLSAGKLLQEEEDIDDLVGSRHSD